MTQWSKASVPNMEGKTVIVTGGNSGIGLVAATVLAGKGADVILAVRNESKGEAALSRIRQDHPSAKVRWMTLDLADLSSIHRFAEASINQNDSLSLLVGNAGVMAVPYQRTKDGFEMQFGTNHLGHFALTGLLLPLLLKTPFARVVVVSSNAHKSGHIDFDNLDGLKGYHRWKAYSQSKLANLLFAYELQRRFVRFRADAICTVCHPGFASTNLVSAGIGGEHAWIGKIASGLTRAMAQSADMGALPTLFAATEPTLRGGEYVGPNGLGEMKGFPQITTSNRESYNEAIAVRLWAISEQATGVRYDWSGLSED